MRGWEGRREGGRSSRAKHPSGKNPQEAGAGDTRVRRAGALSLSACFLATRRAQLVII